MALMHLDRGDRRTLQVSFTHDGTDPAPSYQFAVVPRGTAWVPGDWFTVAPVDADANPAVYEITLAYGAVDDFPTAHPAGTITVTGESLVLSRPPSGRDIDVEEVARIRPR